MGWDQIFVDAGIAKLIGAKASIDLLDTPYPDLRAELLIDLGDNIGVFDDELERDDVTGCMDTFVGASTADKGRFLGIICVSF